MKNLEQRFIEWDQDTIVCTETRASGNDDTVRSISGYAARFEKLSVDLGGFREKIAPGAFSGSLKRDVVALWSHNIDIVLGRRSNNTLTLEEDESGLRFSLELPDTQAGRDAFTSIKRKDVRGMSFGFSVPPKGDDWEVQNDKSLIRTLRKVDLFEVSPTAFPAYPQTSVSARGEIRSLQEVLAYGKTQLPPTDLDHGRSLAANRNRLRLLEVSA